MGRRYTPTVGDLVVVEQRTDRLDKYGQRTGEERMRRYEYRVHYIRTNGRYQIESENGRRLWVGPDNVIRREWVDGFVLVRGLARSQQRSHLTHNPQPDDVCP